jgi:hypothetical protein
MKKEKDEDAAPVGMTQPESVKPPTAWEVVDEGGKGNDVAATSRLKVDGGWLYHTVSAAGNSALAFVKAQ